MSALFSAVADGLAAGETVAVVGSGILAVRNRAARQGHNSGTGERVAISGSKAPAFKLAKALRDAVR